MSIKKLKKFFDIKLTLDQVVREARRSIDYSTPLTKFNRENGSWETIKMDFNDEEMLTVKDLHIAEMEVYLVIEAMKEDLLDLKRSNLD
tara:strand:- start:228 stop:494 length:267 start_codon:yes stop_codon:yes gene_type:complete